MADGQPQTTYLELSEDSGGAHKFYEVTIDETKVTIRYGRIGDKGATQESSFATADQAKAFAAKKIKEKTSKGYAPAVMGQRQKRSIVRRQVVSQATTPAARAAVAAVKTAPVLWKFNTGSNAFGIFIDDEGCWAGNEQGRVFKLDHEGDVLRQFQLPDGIKCLVSDGDWMYAGCDDGNVYDLTGKLPRLAYAIDERVSIFWLDIANALLGVSDDKGDVTAINYEDEEQWTQKSQGQMGWMVRVDERGYVYHGTSAGVTAYDGLDRGTRRWFQKTVGQVLFGWREGDTLYAGTTRSRVEAFTTEGKAVREYSCSDSIFANTASEGGKYVFAGDASATVYCFEADGTLLWRLKTGCGSALSMQYHKERLYLVTTHGFLACLDASEAAIQNAQQGVVPQAVTLAAPPKAQEVASDTLETATDTSQGVIVECYREGGALRVRVLSSGYHSDWRVQFPKNIRQEGAKYLVDEIRESAQGGFYRAYGNIYKL